MSRKRRTLWLLPFALLALGAERRPRQVDAIQVSCAEFGELGLDNQKRILSFLQGYGQREIPQDKVGPVPIAAGLTRVLDACPKEPSAPVWSKVQELAPGKQAVARGEARLTRPPTELTCKSYLKLDREDRRMTVYWLDGYSRAVDASDLNQSVVALDRDPEDLAKNACGKRKQRLWWAIQGSVRSVQPAPSS
ncbi:MAG TPA: HdeA/HdeB family chaperone [Myxococcota bacterium]|nr:HdeA/HdeB family chaperone [Myxococcota bacterium]